MTRPDEVADVLAGTVAAADPALPPVAAGAPGPDDVQSALPELGDETEEAPAPGDPLREVEEVDLTAGPDGHVDLRLLSDVQVELAVELGRITLPLRALLGLAPGSVLQLDRPADAPVDVLVNDSPVSRGEVVVLDGDFGVRVTGLVDR